MNNFVNVAVVLNCLEHIPRFRKREDAFDLEEEMFRKIFRLTKDEVEDLIEDLSPLLTHPSRISAIDIETKVLMFLRFLASGSYQHDIAFNRHFNVSQPTVSRYLYEVVGAMNTPRVMNKYIHFPNSFQELTELRDNFQRRHNIPAIGCVDCTHVAIFPPPSNDEEHPEHVYVNRKGYHSLNVQLICDYNLNILNVNAKYPGSAHDTYIWNSSNANQSMKEIYRRWPHENFHFLGDSGYPLRPWLIVPFDDPAEGSLEDLFNDLFLPARSSTERGNGVIKMMFRSLLKHRVLHYYPTMGSEIVNASIVLHNLRRRVNTLTVQASPSTFTGQR